MRRNSYRRGRADRRGFTLMELLLVMAILVIMASMVTFAFLQIQQNAQSDATLSQISTLKIASNRGDFARAQCHGLIDHSLYISAF